MTKCKAFLFGTKKRAWLTVLSLILMLSVIVGLIWGILASQDVVLSYRSLRVREGVFAYLYTYYRYAIPASDYYKKQGVVDSPAFWNEMREDGQTNSQYYGELALQFVYETIVAARIYDATTNLPTSVRSSLAESWENVKNSTFQGGGSERSFNEKAKPFGFDYEDFKDATLMQAKASLLQVALYGGSGSTIDNATMADYVADHYTHIRMIFIRTKDKFVKNPDGTYKTDGEGNILTEPMTDQEKAEQAAKIETVKQALADGTTVEEFEGLFITHNDDASALKSGYYFSLSDTSDYTKAYKAAFPAVIEAMRAMEIGEVSCVQSDIATHFLYRTTIDEGAYLSQDNKEFFRDVGQLASNELFAETIKQAVSRIRVHQNDLIASLDYGATLPNKELIITLVSH